MKRWIAICLYILLLPVNTYAGEAVKEMYFTREAALEQLYTDAGRPKTDGGAPFADIAEDRADAVHWAYDRGILQGYPGGTCRLEEPVTLEQLALMLYRHAGLPEVQGDLFAYDDRTNVSPWAMDALCWAEAAGLLPRKEGYLAPQQGLSDAEAQTVFARLGQLPDLTALQADLNALTEQRHPVGSQGEAAAAAYLASRFAQMGYAVELQPYTAADGAVGSNVIALRTAGENADILVISAHHDCVPTSFGANDNASGVAALLQIASQLAEKDTDTELRFISFTDEENGKNGSRLYLESLPADQRSRIVGCIQLDMLGGLGAKEHAVYTTDGQPNWLSDLLQNKQSSLELGTETASDHASFQLAGVPAVLVGQTARGYLYHGAGDTASQLDLWQIQRAAELVCAAAETVMSDDTASYQALAREQADGYLYRQQRHSYILFSSTRQENEAMIGLAGTLTERREDIGEFWHDVYETYRYDMCWFSGEKPMATHYVYRNDYLEQVELYPALTGYTTEQVYDLLCSVYGSPADADAENRNWNWEDLIYSKYITLEESEGSPKVSVFSYSMGLGNILASYEVVNGQAYIEDPAHRAVWDLYCSVLPPEHRQKIGEFQLFTDGYGAALAYAAAMDGENGYDNSRFSIGVDYYDVYDENGVPRDHSKLLYTLIHEYGHVLLEDDTQIDLTISADVHDSAGFIQNSFRKQFYDTFWQDDYSSYLGSYEEAPENYVSEYSAYAFYEDIAETFAVFVFGGRPIGDSIAEQKLQMFWADSAMTALRADIRFALGLN